MLRKPAPAICRLAKLFSIFLSPIDAALRVESIPHGFEGLRYLYFFARLPGDTVTRHRDTVTR